MSDDADQLLVARVREGGSEAWEELIARYEGRLLAFVQSRIGNRTTSEDVVQETLMGFLTSLPNYDSDRTRLESFLFSIAAHKLTDVLRRQGRRPTLPLLPPDASGSGFFTQFDRIRDLTNSAISLIDNAVPISADNRDPFTEATANILTDHTDI